MCGVIFFDEGNQIATASAAAEFRPTRPGCSGGFNQPIQFGRGDGELLQEEMIGVHQRSQRSPFSILYSLFCILRNSPNLIEHLFPFGFVRFPQLADIAHGFLCRRGDARVCDNEGEGRATLKVSIGWPRTK